MLTHLTIENFKGFGGAVDLEFAPITFLYGPNSSGKSSVKHALLYLYEVIANQWSDVDVCSLAAVDLGGYDNLINREGKDENIRFYVVLDRESDVEAAFDYPNGFVNADVEALDSIGSELYNLNFLGSEWGVVANSKIGIELKVSWSRLEKKPFISSIGIDLEGDPLLRLECKPNLREAYITGINFSNRSLSCHGAFKKENVTEHPFYQLLQELSDISQTDADQPSLYRLPVKPSLAGALPDLDRPLEIMIGESRYEELSSYLYDSDDESRRNTAKEEFDELKNQQLLVTEFFSQTVLYPLICVKKAIGNMISIGPIREVPARNFMPRKRDHRERWQNGLAAWDYLSCCPKKEFDRVSRWFFRLRTGYTLAKNDQGQVLLQDESGALFYPEDVGIGISQLLPCVVAACRDFSGIVAIEQPELHIHPALQVEIGDLLVASLAEALDDNPSVEVYGSSITPGLKFLLESHSEHILLRALKRIRETTEGDLDETPWMKLFPRDVSVIYIDKAVSGTRVQRLRIDEDGDFIDRWPNGFFSERADELF